MIRLAGLLIALSSLLLGCAEDPKCKVTDNQDGTSTIRCPGAPPVTVPHQQPGAPTCTISQGEAPGEEVIRCSDGRVVKIVDGHVVFPGSGSVAGVALLYGADDHSGIVVRLEGSHLQTTTASDGSYRIDSIPAGNWTVVFEAAHRSTRRIIVPIIAGVFPLDPVELRAGHRIVETGKAQISPTGDSALGVLTWDDMAWVSLWKVGASEPLLLGHTIRSWGYDKSGSAVYTLDRETFAGTLRYWSVESGRHVVVAKDVTDARFAGHRLVFHHQPLGETCQLKVWTPPGDEPIRDLGPCVPGDGWSVTPDAGAIAYHRPDGMRVIQELDDGLAREIGFESGWTPWIFSPSGRFVVFFGDRSTVTVLDRETGETDILDPRPSVMDIRFSPADDTLLVTIAFPDGSAELWLHELETKTSQLLFVSTEVTVEWRFSNNGRRLAGRHWDWQRNPSRLIVLDRIRPESPRYSPLELSGEYSWGPDGADVLLPTEEGHVLWEVDTGAEPILLSQNPEAVVSWSRDGELIAFGETERVTVFDRRLRTTRELGFVGSEITGLVWLPVDHALLIRRESIYGSDLRFWPLGSERSPEPLLNQRFSQVIPDDDGRGFLYVQCGSTCAERVMGHYDLEARKAAPLDGQVDTILTRKLGLLYEIEEGPRGGWYFAPRP